MTSFGFIRLFRVFLAIGLVYIVSSYFIVSWTLQRVQNELRFQRLYGNDWVAQYEKYEEPVMKSNILIGVGAAYVIGMCIFLLWVYRRATSKRTLESGRRRHRYHYHRHHRH